MYGHLAKYCRNTQRCSNCGDEEHSYKDCNKDKSCPNCLQYNNKFGRNYEGKHNARDNCCLIKEKEIDNLKTRINYGY